MPYAGSGPADSSATIARAGDDSAQVDVANALELAIQIIENEFSSFLPHDDRVVASCDLLRVHVPALCAPGGRTWWERLVPLPSRRAGSCVPPLFTFLEELADDHPQPWPILEVLLGARESELQRRALTAFGRLVEAGRIEVTPEVFTSLSNRAEDEGSALASPAALDELRQIVSGRLSLARLFIDGTTINIRRLAARLLDVGGAFPAHEIIDQLLGAEASARLTPYLAFTCATHADLLDVEPLAANRAALGSFRRAEEVCGAPMLRDVVAAVGWQRLNYGLDARPIVGLSVSGGIPLLVEPREAALFDGLPDVRRVFERTLVVPADGQPMPPPART